MTTPRDRAAFGTHVFPFSGIYATDQDLPDLPMLPVRLRLVGGRWSHPINAILDTGSTRSLVPGDVAADLGISPVGVPEDMHGAGGHFKAAPAVLDVTVVDAQFPEVTCWEVAGVGFGITTQPDSIEFPVIGWDVLRLFDFSLSHRRGRVELRLANET